MTTPHYQDDRVTLWHGDSLDILPTLPDNSIDAVITDPPYGLEFMGKDWDSFGRNTGNHAHSEKPRFTSDHMGKGFDKIPNTYEAGLPFQQWCQRWATECLRVLKPGGHMAAFGGTRTWHRLAVAVEDAGFEIRDNLCWLYGSGFPKSLDVSKAIDRAAGAQREVIGTVKGMGRQNPEWNGTAQGRKENSFHPEYDATAPATDAARQWQGWGTALKPAHEPIILARKPLHGTVANNILAHGTGALNIDASRIEATDSQLAEKYASVQNAGARANTVYGTDSRDRAGTEPHPAGRWPANVILDEHAAAQLDQQSGITQSSDRPHHNTAAAHNKTASMGKFSADWTTNGHNDSGGASRFFYTAKAAQDERPTADGVCHPTVKPLNLMRWLVRLVTPPGGTVLDPFAGTGTTGEACIHEYKHAILIEREADYLPLIVARLTKPMQVGFDFDEATA